MTIECDQGHATADIVYRRPAQTPRDVKILRYVMIVGVLLTLANMISLAVSLSGISDVSAEVLAGFEELRAEVDAEASQGGASDAEIAEATTKLAYITDIVRAFDNLIIFGLLGAFVGVFVIIGRYAKLLWKGFSAGAPATYNTVKSIATMQFVVMVATFLGPLLVFAGNERINYFPGFGIGMLVPFVIHHYLKKDSLKAYFSVYSVKRGADIAEAPSPGTKVEIAPRA